MAAPAMVAPDRPPAERVVMQEVVLETPPVAQVAPGQAMPPRVALRAVPEPVVPVQATPPVMLGAVLAVPGAAVPVATRPRLLQRVATGPVLRRAAVLQRAVTVVRVVLRPRVTVAQVRAVLELLVRAVPELAGQVAPAVP